MMIYSEHSYNIFYFQIIIFPVELVKHARNLFLYFYSASAKLFPMLNPESHIYTYKHHDFKNHIFKHNDSHTFGSRNLPLSRQILNANLTF